MSPLCTSHHSPTTTGTAMANAGDHAQRAEEQRGREPHPAQRAGQHPGQHPAGKDQQAGKDQAGQQAGQQAGKDQAGRVLAVRRASSVSLHSKVVSLEQHCAQLKQQKRVAEKFASTAQAQAEATAQLASTARAEADLAKRQRTALEARLADSERRAKHFEQLAEQRLGEVYHLRRKFDVSFQSRVEEDVFRAIEATGQADVFPHGLTPTLAAVQSKVGGAALQRRAARLADLTRHPLGLHPGVHEWASGSSFDLLKPADFMLDT